MDKKGLKNGLQNVEFETAGPKKGEIKCLHEQTAVLEGGGIKYIECTGFDCRCKWLDGYAPGQAGYRGITYPDAERIPKGADSPNAKRG